MINPNFAGWANLFWAVTAVTITSLVLGALHRTFGQPSWLSAIGKTREEPGQSNGMLSPRSFMAALLAELLMVSILTLLIICLGIKTRTGGVAIGFLVGLGAVAISMVRSHAFRRVRSLLTVNDAGH
jgi:hypothetical protein